MSELAEAFAASPAPDATAWRTDLQEADELLAADELTDPFGPAGP